MANGALPAVGPAIKFPGQSDREMREHRQPTMPSSMERGTTRFTRQAIAASEATTFSNTGTTTILGGTTTTPAAASLYIFGNLTVSAGAGAVTIGDTASTARQVIIRTGTLSYTKNSNNLLTLAGQSSPAAPVAPQPSPLPGQAIPWLLVRWVAAAVRRSP